MSETSEKARSAAKEKANRLVRADPKARVDASGYRPDGAMDGDVVTGERPISRRAYKHGGMVEGEKSSHAGRKPRKSGGPLTAESLINRNVKTANEDRGGITHVGGMKGGGRAHKMVGGAMGGMQMPPQLGGQRSAMARPAMGPGNRPMMMRKEGGKVHKDEAQDKKLIHDMGCKCGKCDGGRVGRAPGGAVSLPAKNLAQSAMKMAAKKGTDPYNSQPAQASAYKSLWNMKGGTPARASGGAINDGTRPEGGRMARKSGGRTKKGTNVNIIITQPPQGAPMPPRPMGPPPGPPVPPPGAPPGVGLHQGTPTPMIPAGAMPIQAPPGTMGRKEGGRIDTKLVKPGSYPIKDGAGGAKGRMEKAKAYGL
jgi:hypothetical protein